MDRGAWPATVHGIAESNTTVHTLTSIHDYWKIITSTRRTFVGKVMSLLLNRLSRLGMTFLPRRKRLLRSPFPSPELAIKRASLVAQLVKNLPAMWETWVRSLGWEDPLEKG